MRLFLLAPLLLVACATPPVEIGAADFAPLRAFDRERFPGADELLREFDARPAKARRHLDAALFGVEVHRGDEIDRRLLWIESPRVDAPIEIDGETVFTARLIEYGTITTSFEGREPETNRYKLTVRSATLRHCRADGELVKETTIRMHDEAMKSGFWGYAFPDSTREQSDLGSLYTFAMQDLAQQDETLQELLFLVVDKPSILSVVANLGVSVALNWSVELGNEVAWSHPAGADDGWGDELRSLQLTIGINGSQALFGDLLACEPAGGLAVAGGLCGAVFRHPTEQDRWAVVRLLAVHAPDAADAALGEQANGR